MTSLKVQYLCHFALAFSDALPPKLIPEVQSVDFTFLLTVLHFQFEMPITVRPFLCSQAVNSP
jgi:hypothetical protein